MKIAKRLLCCFILLFTTQASFATATRVDVTIYMRDLKQAHVTQIPKIQSNLDLKPSQAMVIKHVVTTGRTQANRQSVYVNIGTLEKIRPRLRPFYILKNARQIPMTNQQVHSLVKLLHRQHRDLPKWLLNNKQKKYINVVLLKKAFFHKSRVSAISTKNAQRLVKWAIKNKRLVPIDHPKK